MVLIAANQKSTIDVYTKKKDQSKHNTKDSYRITIEENKRGRDLQKQILRINKMAIRTYILIITFICIV